MKTELTTVQKIKINNRNISYRRIGTGKRKVLFFHGFPGSSAQIEPFLDYIQDFDLEVLCFDRPGYHDSDATNESQFAQTTEVCRQIVDSFSWSSCELVSVSGGTPFLFSFLEKHPQFISRVSVVCGLGPITASGFQDLMTWKAKMALKVLPHIPGKIFAKIFPLPNDNAPEVSQRFDVINYFLPPSVADKKTFENPKIQQILRQAVLEAVKQSGKGPKLDAKSFLTPWNMKVPKYKGPVHFWHGDDDNIIPLAMAQRMHQQIQHSKLSVIKGGGHYSLAFDYLQPVLAEGVSK